MKNRPLITLPLSAVLAVSMFAQQPNSNSKAQAAPSGDQTASTTPPVTPTSKKASQPKTDQDFWDGDEPGLAWLVLHPFASKQYVQRHTQTIHDGLNELDELTAANSKMIKDLDARSQHGIQLASDKTNLADEHTTEAANRAALANQTVTAVATRLSTVETIVGATDRFKSAATTEISFGPGQNVLSKQAKNSLDELAAQLKDQHGYVVEVQGFSPGQGQTAITNSRQIADAVVRYLVFNHEIPTYRIYVIGMGNASATSRKIGRRVEINVLKNDLEQTANQ